MPIVMNMPQIGESVTEGTIVRWLKQEGDAIGRDEPVAEVMTDKVTVEIPALVAGWVGRRLAAEGETILVGAPLIEFLTEQDRTQPRPDSGRPGLSPVVRRLLDEHKIRPAEVPGTGQGGRITREDVQRVIEQRAAAPKPASAPVSSAAVLRRHIADHLTKVQRDIPAAWMMQEANVSTIVGWRNTIKDTFRQKHGVPLTFVPFMIRAVAESLRVVPAVNARWENGQAIVLPEINVGVAVAVDDGLVVPVIRRANLVSVIGLASALADITDRARRGALRPQDVEGGTITVNNTGAFGSVLSVPMVNSPQAAIVTMEAIKKRPVVLENDAIAVRWMMNICMTFDHRVIDGAVAGRFLAEVRDRLERAGPAVPLE